jgi:hypothetical protein
MINFETRVATRVEIDVQVKEGAPVIVKSPLYPYAPVALVSFWLDYVDGEKPTTVRARVAKIKNDGTLYADTLSRSWFGRDEWPPVIKEIVERLDRQYATPQRDEPQFELIDDPDDAS